MSWRRKRDSNPRTLLQVYELSKPAPSTTWVFLRIDSLMVDPAGLEPATTRL